MLPVTLIAACWALGEGFAHVTGDVLPGPVAGLLALTAVLVVRPGLQERVAPVAGALVRALPLLFVPAVVAVGAVTGDVDVAAFVVALLVSVPVGFAVTARIVR